MTALAAVTAGQWVRRAAAVLKEAGVEAAGLEARVLAGHVLGLSAADVVLEADRPLEPGQRAAADRLLRRRVAGEPLQYLIGRAEFWSLTLEVSPAVLIPRPETEHLVESVLEHVRGTAVSRPLLADLGTGSGAVAAALAHELPLARVYAVDIDPRALATARRNVTRLGLAGRVTLLQGSWCRPLLAAGLRGRLDALAANPPYVALEEAAGLAAQVRCFEPPVALFTGADPLSAYRAIVAGAPALLKPGGLLALEVAPHRAGQVAELLERCPRLEAVRIDSDYAGRPRVVSALRGPAVPPRGERR